MYQGNYLYSFLTFIANYTVTSHQCIINYKKLYHNLSLVNWNSRKLLISNLTALEQKIYTLEFCKNINF